MELAMKRNGIKRDSFLETFCMNQNLNRNDIKYRDTHGNYDIVVYWNEEAETLIASCPVLGLYIPEDNKYKGNIDELVEELTECIDDHIDFVKERNNGIMHSLYLDKQINVVND